jgi:hypothetical protein
MFLTENSACGLNGWKVQEKMLSVVLVFLNKGFVCFVMASQIEIDMAFFTCCILNNLLLAYDGLDVRWESGVNWTTLNPQGRSHDDYDENGEETVTLSVVELNLRARLAANGNTTYGLWLQELATLLQRRWSSKGYLTMSFKKWKRDTKCCVWH